MDEGMSDVVSGETAKKLKERIKEQKKFLVLFTHNSKDSRWVPWELGSDATADSIATTNDKPKPAKPWSIWL
jgi:hypothetical protein